MAEEFATPEGIKHLAKAEKRYKEAFKETYPYYYALRFIPNNLNSDVTLETAKEHTKVIDKCIKDNKPLEVPEDFYNILF